MRIFSLMALLALACDQLSKLVVVHWMDLKTIGLIDVAPPFLTFRMGWNYGINFGLFSGVEVWARWVLIIIALLIVGMVAIWMRNGQQGKWALISAGLLTGGALGNVVDRIMYGAVADFLNTSCCGFDNPYAFNVADISIFVGAIGLMFFADGKKAA